MNLWLVVNLESEQRENVNRKNDLINNILISVLINIICPSQMFLSNGLFYYQCYLPLSAVFRLSLTTLSLSLCLSTVMLYSPSVLFDINPWQPFPAYHCLQ